ncbi:CcdC protein domain-containing protein, partial [Staphylococcus aureus]|uniref:CcdC protein domain-containing protein n=1 Tax=Staphylococcus aureus TaxID=1280 RepID=UPI003F9A7E7B
MLYFIFSIIVALFMGTIVIVFRMNAQYYPVYEKKIVLPPFFMATGALMFV